MVNGRNKKIGATVLSFSAFALLLTGTMGGIQHDWFKMALSYAVFAFMIFVLMFGMLTFQLEKCFKHLETLILDNNTKPSTKNYETIERIPALSMVLSVTVFVILAIISGFYESWFMTGVFLVAAAIAVLTCTAFLFVLKVNALRRHFEDTVINKLEM